MQRPGAIFAAGPRKRDALHAAATRSRSATVRVSQACRPKKETGEKHIAGQGPTEEWNRGGVAGSQSGGGLGVAREPQPASEIGHQEKLDAVDHGQGGDGRNAFGAAQPPSQPHADQEADIHEDLKIRKGREAVKGAEDRVGDGHQRERDEIRLPDGQARAGEQAHGSNRSEIGRMREKTRERSQHREGQRDGPPVRILGHQQDYSRSPAARVSHNASMDSDSFSIRSAARFFREAMLSAPVLSRWWLWPSSVV